MTKSSTRPATNSPNTVGSTDADERVSQASHLERLSTAMTRGFRHSLSGFDSEHRVTMGIVLGMLAGLLPKDSLLAYFFLAIMILSLANLMSGALAVLAFSGMSPLLDRWSDPLGQAVLTQPALQGLFHTLMQLPLLPWMRFDNTIVMGHFLIGLALVYPVYGISYRVYARIKPRLLRWFATRRSTRWLVQSEIGQVAATGIHGE